MAKVSPAPVKQKAGYSINSVDNALDLLEAICDEGGEARISRLSQRLGMNKTRVYRLLATFENRGFVERGEGSVKYRLGLSAYEMGQKLLSRMGILRLARPVMERLARQCNESVYFMVRRNDEVLLLDMIDSTQQVKIAALTGQRFPLAATAVGELFLAFGEAAADGEIGAAAAARDGMRRQGVCVDEHAFGEGVVCLAVPLLNAKGEAAAVMAILGPAFRMSPERIEAELAPQLKEAGHVISAGLGYLGHYLRCKTI